MQGDGTFARVVEVILRPENLGAFRVEQPFADEVVDRPARGEGGVQRKPGLGSLLALGELVVDVLGDPGVEGGD